MPTTRGSGPWSRVGATVVIGALIGQLFGNALYEELVYRGFLFPQLLLALARRWPHTTHRPLVVALLVSQLLFAVRHIPGAVSSGMTAADIALDLLRLTVLGILFALLYLRTGNLFIAVGIHALMNAPTALFAPVLIDPAVLAIGLAVILLLVWPRRRKTH